MTKVIKLDVFDPSSAIKELEAYRNKLESMTTLLVKRLGELGMKNASYEFSRAYIDYSGETTVDVELTDHSAIISASGTQVLFIEFGAGITYNGGTAHPLSGEFGYSIGGYGRGMGKNPYWYDYLSPTDTKPKKTSGNPAGKCMYLTSKDLRHKLTQIAKEVFSIK